MSDYRLTAPERETIISTTEADDEFNVFTYNLPLIRKLERLRQERPEEVTFVKENSFGGREYTVPKNYVKISPPVKRNLTEEQRQLMAERFARSRAKQRQAM